MDKKNFRSSDIVEKQLISDILDGNYPRNSTLPPERELAAKLGVGRPTLREAIQRLERDGWVTINKSQPATVNDYWQKGNLNTLVNIVQNKDKIPEDFIVYLLELRATLIPSYVKTAVNISPAKVVSLLSNIDLLSDIPNEYAEFDWRLQKKLAGISGNPIYLLILNSFDDFYVEMAKEYFTLAENRNESLVFYQRLLAAAMKADTILAEEVTAAAMKKSIELWRKRLGVI